MIGLIPTYICHLPHLLVTSIFLVALNVDELSKKGCWLLNPNQTELFGPLRN